MNLLYIPGMWLKFWVNQRNAVMVGEKVLPSKMVRLACFQSISFEKKGY